MSYLETKFLLELLYFKYYGLIDNTIPVTLNRVRYLEKPRNRFLETSIQDYTRLSINKFTGLNLLEYLNLSLEDRDFLDQIAEELNNAKAEAADKLLEDMQEITEGE